MRSAVATAGLLSVALSTTALAQIGTGPIDQAGTPVSPNPAASQTGRVRAGGASRPGGLEEVVVTAQRRRENLQNVPIAVTAISGAKLVQSGISSVQDLRIAVPGLQVVNTAAAASITLRGVGSAAFGPGVESPIALYVDGVYIASQFGQLIDFVNVDQVEVLKGPQGTLFGRNATGGLIQVTTKTPTQTPHLDMDVGYGSYNTVKGDLYASGGVAPGLAADIAAQVSQQGDGYGTNFYNGRDVDQVTLDLNLRSKWVYTPLEGTKITAIFDYSKLNGSVPYFRVLPGTSAPPPTGPNYGGSVFDTDSNADPYTHYQGGGASVRLEQSLGFADLVDTAAFRQLHTDAQIDLDSTAVPYEAVVVHANEEQFSNELQLQSHKDSKLKWVGGIFYFDDHGRDDPSNVSFDPVPGLGPAGPLTALQSFGAVGASSIAGYAQATYEVLPATNLTLGGRYTFERRTFHASEYAEIGPIPLGELVSSYASKDFYNFSYRAALDHRFSKELLVYGSVSSGFKSGGFNAGSVTDPPYAPEKLTAFEVGAKTDFLDNRLRINGSGFYYNYRNIQVQRLEVGTAGISNGASSHLYGADGDVQAQVTDDLRLTASFEYLHARFLNYPDALISSPSGLTPIVSGSATGNYLPYSPDLSGSIAADYVVQNLFHGALDLNGTYFYDSGFYTEPDNVVSQGAFQLANISARWKSDSAHYTVAFYINNLTDKRVLQGGATQTFGLHQGNFIPPRLVGFTLGYHF
jgi:iron complex outermembrane receptor protein